MTGLLVAVSERLYEEFGSTIPLSSILLVLRQCRDELDVVPQAALPELCERLARQRLIALATGVLAWPEPDVSGRSWARLQWLAEPDQ